MQCWSWNKQDFSGAALCWTEGGWCKPESWTRSEGSSAASQSSGSSGFSYIHPPLYHDPWICGWQSTGFYKTEMIHQGERGKEHTWVLFLTEGEMSGIIGWVVIVYSRTSLISSSFFFPLYSPEFFRYLSIWIILMEF